MPKHVLELKLLKKPIKVKDIEGNISTHSYTHLAGRWFKNSPFNQNESCVMIQPMRMVGSEGEEYLYAFCNKYNCEWRDISLLDVESILDKTIKDIGDKDIIDSRF